MALVEALIEAKGLDHSGDRAEVLVAAFDGILLGAVSRPSRGRRAFVTRSLELLMAPLSGAERRPTAD